MSRDDHKLRRASPGEVREHERERERSDAAGATTPAAPGTPLVATSAEGGWTEDWRALVRAGRFTQARAVIRTVGANAEQISAVEVLAEVQELAREKSWSRALGRIERLTELRAPVDLSRLERELHSLRKASGRLDRRDPDDALTTLADLDDAFLDAEVATQRGTAYVLMNEPARARAEFERALEVDPRHYRAMTNLGNLALEDGETDAAIAAYEGALRINDDFSNAHHNLGVALRRKGNVARSVRSLRRAQKAMQQQDAQRARESATGLPVGRIFRWLLIGGIAIALYVWLNQRGVI